MRLAQDCVAVAGLDDLATIHDGDAVGDASNNPEIVRDENESDTRLALDVGEEVQDLRLDSHIEGGGGFISDDHLRLAKQRHRN
jgi:hypothetical protein